MSYTKAHAHRTRMTQLVLLHSLNVTLKVNEAVTCVILFGVRAGSLCVYIRLRGRVRM